ncbi:MAG: hypothetical protein RIQ75_2328, partial [Pseudomonadota bacterium]
FIPLPNQSLAAGHHLFAAKFGEGTQLFRREG